MKRLLLILIIICAGTTSLFAKTDKFGTWVELTFTKKFLKDFEFSIIPEVRFQDDFTVDEYIFEGKLGYEPLKFLELSASYRYNTNVKKKGNEISHNVVFDVTGKTDYKRFDGALRFRLTNDYDADDIPWETFYFRPRVKLKYDIRKVKIDPYVCYEVFYNMKNKDLYKGRFDIGVTRKITKQQKIGLYYRNQDYFSIRQSVHILGIDYGFKF
ncbi:hypothetical protein MASR2M47_39480 [Draconibacterium sp.]|jgi:hypothetical protein